MSAMHETMVRTYTDPGAYNKEASRLAKDGWSVANVAERRPRAGCLRLLFLWWLTLLRPPKPELIVTYTRPKP